MAQDTAPRKNRTQAQLREDRLKAALKANMARRKAQARARQASDEDAPVENGTGPTGSDTES